jgi:hypothetical protein
MNKKMTNFLFQYNMNTTKNSLDMEPPFGMATTKSTDHPKKKEEKLC